MAFRSLYAQRHIRGGHSSSTRSQTRSRCFIEQLEPRLALTWAGTPPASISPPTNALSVTLNSANSANGAASITTTEVDYYVFTAPVSGTYSIGAATPSSSLDTVLGVFSANGQRLAFNDDISYPSNADSRVGVNLAAGTQYYVGVTNYASSSRGAYTWAITGPTTTATPTTDDAYENNDSQSAAAMLGILTATRTVNSLVMADASDWFRFTTNTAGTASSSVSISFQNAQGNLQLALYNSSGTLLTTSQSTGNSESVSLNGRAAGTYYVRIYGASGASNPNYSLTVNPPAASTPTPTPTPSGFQITLNMSGLTASQQNIFRAAADRWSQVIVGDLPNATYRGQTVDDLLINASSISIDGVSGILGQAGPDAFRSGSALPYHGVMQFDSADMANMERNGTLFSVVLHEMGHVLGVGTLWEDLGLLSGAGTSNPIFTGAQATAAYNQLFGTSARGVPVENTGGSGTRDSHWRESTFTSELMTGWVGPGTNLPLSTITIGSLADIGYSVNSAAADSYARPSIRSSTSSVLGSSNSASLLSSESVWILSTGPTTSIALVDSTRAPASTRNPAQRGNSLTAANVDRAVSSDFDPSNESRLASRVNRRLDCALADLCQAMDEHLGELAVRVSLS
jgi:hypothetical protein